jgi:hypothetical protein
MNRKDITLSNGGQITVLDDVFDYRTRYNFYRFIRSALFRCTGKDAPEDKEETIFSSFSENDLNNLGLFTNHQSTPILELIEGYNVTQTLVNLSTPTDKNRYHIDTPKSPTSKTLLFYPNLKWPLEWCGHTVFANESLTDVEFCSAYVPGRIVWFDGNIPHSITPPSTLAETFRFSLAVQMSK